MTLPTTTTSTSTSMTTAPRPQRPHHHHHHHHRRAHQAAPAPRRVPLRLLFRAASVACGIQFGWALQLSLLTPYVQELGIPHTFASLVWLCGPLSGLLVQPLVGHFSDRSRSPFGRRRPYIVAGAASVALAVLLVGFSADIGGLFGDPTDGPTRPRAVIVFVLGFWLLDVGNNTTQGPNRALLADLAGSDHRRTRVGNAYYSLFMALGNILGYATGSYSGWYSIFPFTVTSHCSINCANLKSAFLLDIVMLALTTCTSISVKETPGYEVSASAEDGEQQMNNEQEAFIWELFGSIRYLTLPVWIVLIVTALTWIAWFPFVLFDTDWMGREIYKGEPDVGSNYQSGVRMGAFGLMLNSLILGITSVAIEKVCRKLGTGLVWGISNMIMTICFVAMLVIALAADKMEAKHDGLPPNGVVIAAVIVFTILGIPLAITYIVPYAMFSARAESMGLGQGLAMGILNLAIVLPQVIISVGSGPLDQLFGGGNSPAFAVAAISSFIGGLIAITSLPRTSVAKVRKIHSGH